MSRLWIDATFTLLRHGPEIRHEPLKRRAARVGVNRNEFADECGQHLGLGATGKRLEWSGEKDTHAGKPFFGHLPRFLGATKNLTELLLTLEVEDRCGHELTDRLAVLVLRGPQLIHEFRLARERLDRDLEQVVGQGLARDIARKVDAAFFGTRGASPVTPAGLGDLTGVNAVAGPAAWADVDPFLEAIYAAEGVGATVGAFVANPADALALAQLKESAGSNRTLLTPDATQPARRLLAGIPLLTSPGVAAGTVWGIPADRALVAVRQDAELTVSTDAYFGSDQTAVRAILRIAFAFPHAAAIQKITLTP